MASADFNYVTLRTITPSNADGSYVNTGYVFTVGPDSKQFWTNNLRLNNVVVSTIIVNSTVHFPTGIYDNMITSSSYGSTMVTEQLQVLSTLYASTLSITNASVSSLFGSSLVASTLTGSTIYYSVLLGSSLTTSSIQVPFLNVPLLTTSSLAVSTTCATFFTASTSFFSTAVGSTVTINQGTVNTLRLNNATYSTLTGSTLTTSTLSVSSLNGSAVFYSTLLGSTAVTSTLFASTMSFSTGTGNLLTTTTHTTTNFCVNNGFFSTLTGSSLTTSTLSGSTLYYSTLIGSTLTTSTLFGSTLFFSTSMGSTLTTLTHLTTTLCVNNGFFSSLTGSTLTTSTLTVSTLGFSTALGSTLTASAFISQSTILGSTLNIINATYSTLQGSTLSVNTVVWNSTLIGSTINTINATYSTLSGSTLLTNTAQWNSTLIGSTLNSINIGYSTMTGSTLTANTIVFTSTVTGSTITSVNHYYSTLMGSTITTSTINAATLLTISSGSVGIGVTNPTYALQTAPQNSVNLSNSFLATWVTLPTDVFQSFTALTNGTLTGSTGVNGIFTIGAFSSGEVLFIPNLIPGTVYRLSFTVSMTGVSPSFYLFNHVTGDSIIGSPTSISNTPATYNLTFTAPSGKIGIAFTYSGAIVSGNVATWTGFTLQGFYNQSPGGVGIGTTNPQYSLHVTNGSVQAYNFQQFEWINTQSSNTLGYAPSNGVGLYKIATLGPSSSTSSYGMINLRGQLGGFLYNTVMYVDLTITTRGGLTVYGSVYGAYAAAVPICDLVYNINSANQYDLYIYIKQATNLVYDLMVSGASGNNILYDPVATSVIPSVASPISITGLALQYTNTGLIGIGKSNPAYTLDVAGSINASSILVNGTSLTSLLSSQWTTFGSNIFYNTGNVGIGTATPTCTLQLYGTTGPCFGIGNSSTTPTVFQVGIASSTGSFSSSASTGDSVIRATSGNLILQTGTSAAALYLQSSTNYVGIGTAAPGWALDVAGIVQGQTAFQSNTNANNAGLGALQQVYLGQYGASAPRGTCVRWGDILGAAYYVNTGSTNLSFYKDVSGGNAALAFQLVGTSLTNATPNVYIPNALGIGTNSPISTLEVYGGALTVASSNNATYGLAIAPILGAGAYSNWSAVGDSVIKQYTGNLMMVTGATGVSGIYLQNSTGNVGIGTGNPQNTLSVYNTTSDNTKPPDGDYRSGHIILQNSKSTLSTPYGMAIGLDQTYGFGYLNAAGNGLAQSICINTRGGNVGIGTTNPSYTLHVIGTIYASGDITGLSDRRYKQDITPLSRSLDLLQQITGYSYSRSDHKPGVRQIGLIAQEVNEVFPEAVSYDRENDQYSVNYGCMIAPLIEAIKELRERVDRQDALLRSKSF